MSTRKLARIGILAICGLGISCATAPQPDPSTGIVWGYVKLVPKAGATAGSGYGDRRLADVKRVDYSHTAFAVVFAPSAPDPAPRPVELEIRESFGSPRVEPRFSATTPASGIRVRNATAADRLVSIPRDGRLLRIAPGDSIEMTGLSEGEASLHLLGLSEAKTPPPAQIWVTEGVTAEVDPSGRYTLRPLEPGRHQVGAWHPRFPPSPPHSLEVTRGSVQRVDIEIGVDASLTPRESVR